MKSKSTIYALFQFLSFVWVTIVITGFVAFTYSSSNNENQPITTSFWIKQLGYILSFHYSQAISVFDSIMIYIAIIIWIITSIIGWFITKVKDRNFYDLLFLMFFVIPFVSNCFCLMAQLSIKAGAFNSTRLTRSDLERVGQELKKEIIAKQNKATKLPTKNTNHKPINNTTPKIKLAQSQQASAHKTKNHKLVTKKSRS